MGYDVAEFVKMVFSRTICKDNAFFCKLQKADTD